MHVCGGASLRKGGTLVCMYVCTGPDGLGLQRVAHGKTGKEASGS